MKITSISYTHTYQIGLAQWQKIGLEASIDETDDVQKSLSKLEQEAHNYHRASNPSLYRNGNEALVSSFNGLPEIQHGSVNGNDLAGAINSCLDLKILESYKLIVKTKPELKEIYDKKYAELSK